MQTYVVIPNYIITEEVKKLAIQTIKSFQETSEVIIVAVDDGSPMDTKFLEEMADVYIRNEKNFGFAKTCNDGFRWIFENEKDDCFIVCANNDIEVYDGWHEAMKNPFDKYDNVAVTGICHSQEREIDGKKLKDIHGSKVTDGGLIGGLMQDGGLWMSKKSILQKVGIFDEIFKRGGHEDIDLFLRMRDTFGMRIIMSEAAWYWHKEGATRWNTEIADFRNESMMFEMGNLNKFIEKWKFNPHSSQIWYSKELIS